MSDWATVAGPSPIDRLLRRDKAVVLLALAALTIIAWVYLVRVASAMRGAATAAEMHAAMGMTSLTAWSAGDIFALFLMWTVMMAGMMLPSAAPMILLVVATYRRRGGDVARAATGAFAAGYLAAWTGFSLLAALAQTALHAAALMSPMMVAQSSLLGAAIFLAAGAYQWLPFKQACLAHCRSPLHFLTEQWREGTAGAFRLGLRHGLFCVGCCWLLMALLFAAGVMNLLAVALIAALVLVEKLVPHGVLAGRVAGAALVAWGMYLIVVRV